MNKNATFWSVLLIALITTYVVYTRVKSNSPHVFLPVPGEVVATSTSIVDQKSVVEENLPYATVSYEIPVQNEFVASSSKAAKDTWLAETGIATIKTKADADKIFVTKDTKYEYKATYTLYQTPDYVSYVYSIYEFTGGAHGSSYNTNYVFDSKTNTRIENLDQLYTDSVYKYLSNFSRNDLSRQIKASGIDMDTTIDTTFIQGTDEKKENYTSFYFKKDALVLIFGQYSVGPYILGILEVEIPLSGLQMYRK